MRGERETQYGKMFQGELQSPNLTCNANQSAHNVWYNVI